MWYAHDIQVAVSALHRPHADSPALQEDIKGPIRSAVLGTFLRSALISPGGKGAAIRCSQIWLTICLYPPR